MPQDRAELLDPLKATEMEIHDAMAIYTDAAKTAMEWVDKIEITNNVTLTDAVQIGKDLRSVDQKIEARRKELVEPLNRRVKFINAEAKDIMEPFNLAMEKTKEKIEAYQIRKRAEAEAEESKIRAERDRVAREAAEKERQRLADENAKQAEEIMNLAKLKAIQDAELKKVKDEQTKALLKIQQEEERAKEASRIQQERSDREAKDAKIKADEKAKAEIEDNRLRNEEAKALGAQKTKNVAMVWNYRIVNEHEVPRQYCEPKPSLIRAAVQAGARNIPGVEIFEEAQTRLG